VETITLREMNHSTQSPMELTREAKITYPQRTDLLSTTRAEEDEDSLKVIVEKVTSFEEAEASTMKM
jgi:hypothetical protein